MSDLPFHPLANLFPLIEGTAFDELASDIRSNGQREDIVTLDGMILDGRNRYRGCLAAGVAPDSDSSLPIAVMATIPWTSLFPKT